MGYLSSLAESGEIEVGEFLPLGEDQQSIGAVGRFVCRVGESDSGGQHFSSCAPWRRDRRP